MPLNVQYFHLFPRHKKKDLRQGRRCWQLEVQPSALAWQNLGETCGTLTAATMGERAAVSKPDSVTKL